MAKLKAKTSAKKSGKKTGAGRALDTSPSHLLHRALQLALDIYTEETGPDAVTQRQYAVLSAVSVQEGLTQTDLVRATGIDRSTLADLVARMIGKNLLARERSAADARANTVRLTAEGRAALETAAPRVAAADARILKLLPARKRDAFLGVLAELSHEAEALIETEEPEAAAKTKKKKAKPEKTAKAEKATKLSKPTKAPKPAKTKAGKSKKPKKAPAPEPANAA